MSEENEKRLDPDVLRPAVAAILEFTSDDPADLPAAQERGELLYFTSKEAYLWAGVATVLALRVAELGGYSEVRPSSKQILELMREAVASTPVPEAHPFQGLAEPGRDGAKIRKSHRFR